MVSRAAPRHAPKGPAAKSTRLRKERDGDLIMGGVPKAKAGVSKSKPAGKDTTSRVSGKKKGVLGAKAQRDILKHASTQDIPMAGVKTGGRNLVELEVGNWSKSKASTNKDGGISSLITWLEKKASNRLSSRVRSVKIKKSRVEDSNLIISVPADDADAFLRLNNWVWAGANVTVRRIGGDSGTTSQTAEVKEMIKNILERRYNMEDKILDLSMLAEDQDLKASNIFGQKSTTEKFFPAMMIVLKQAFDTPKDRDEAIISVSIAGNGLEDTTIVNDLAYTLPKLKNLDLSNNSFDKLEKLGAWKRRFAQLSHLIVSGNPLEQNEPNYVKVLCNWYPNLRMLNNIQVRTEEDIANKGKHVDLPLPVRAPVFQDEGGIAENFIRTFFNGYDSDRNALVGLYYDAMSTFSVAVNTSAPRDSTQGEHTEKQEWDHYIKHSRNLRKISQLPARSNRLCKGQSAIAEVFASLPRTKHPDLAAEAQKWMIEAHIQPGIPDTSGQSASGVDGFAIMIHGEFDEVDAVSGQSRKKRSFDRTFILGPGGSSGVRVHSDMLTVRAYGGIHAFEPDDGPIDAPQATVPLLPNGLTIELAEQMVIELQKQTRMTVDYAKDCLEQVSWDFNAALQAFESVKATLPPAAFIQA